MKCLCCKILINPAILHKVSYDGRILDSIYHNFKFYPVYHHFSQTYDEASESRSESYQWISRYFQQPNREETALYFFTELTDKERYKTPPCVVNIRPGDIVPHPKNEGKLEKFLYENKSPLLNVIIPALQ
jgi:hypothetical protein